MQMSNSIAKLAEALAAAQGEIEGAVKDRSNPAFKSRYADLSAVWEAWQAVGPKNGLAVSQWPGPVTDGRMTLTTVLKHKSGEWLMETLSMPLPKQDPQGYGSAATYARRYALSALAGIAPEDDDGNAASQPAKRKTPDPAQLNPGKEDPGGEDDKRAKWVAWVEEHKAKLRGFEASGDADGVRAWKAKFDTALGRLMAADAELYGDLLNTFDDVATALRPNFTAAG